MIWIILFLIFGMSLLVKIVYTDVIGHWPTWREIFDFHKEDEGDED